MLRHIYLYYTIIRQKNIYFIFICFIPELKAGTVLNFLQELKLRKIGDSSQLSQKKHISIHDFMLEEPCLQRIEVLK